MTDVIKVLKLSEKSGMRLTKELRVFITIMRCQGKDPLTLADLHKACPYPFNGLKKTVYILSNGRGFRTDGRRLIDFRSTSRLPGQQKEIVLTPKGKRLAKQLAEVLSL